MIRKIKLLSDEIMEIFSLAAAQSLKYYHSFTSTSHLFLALIQFLNMNKEDTRCSLVYEEIKKILNSFEIDGTKIQKEFLELNVKGEKPDSDSDFIITLDVEAIRIKDNLKRRAVEEKRTMEIEDFITELFADISFSLFRIFANITDSEQKTENLKNEVIKTFKNEKKIKESSLDKVKEMTNLNKLAKENSKLVINCDKDLTRMEIGLGGRSNKNIILVGPAGCGKTSLVEELARRINDGNVPSFLKEKVIYQLDPNAVLAGTRFRGDFEEKLENILSLVKEDKDAIIFVDEAHTLVNLGDNAEGANSAGNIFKPALSKGDIQMILATTNDEYTKFIEPQKAFNRRFNKILINEPSKKETVEIIKGILADEIKYFGKEFSEELIEKIVSLTENYNLNQANPAKSIDALEMAFSYSKVLKEEKKEIEIEDILKSISLKYDIFVSEKKFKETEEELKITLLGQDEPLSQVIKNLKMVEKKIVDPEKPLFSMILAGPTGVGKTETARIIAKKYFGSEDNLIKINMGEYGSEMDASKLLGTSPGFIGYDDETALLGQIKQKPNSVVLFDEIEKAHPSIFKTFLSLLDDGEVMDNKGNKISFRNSIIMFTTNLGYSRDYGKEVGIGLVKHIDTENQIEKAIFKFFKPEFLGRLDDIIIYKNLSNDVAEILIERYRQFFNTSSGLEIKFSKKDIEEIIKTAKIEIEGARGLKKAVKKQFILSVEKKGEDVC